MSDPKVRRKLIEVSMPLEPINEEALRRKQKAPKGYPTAIHKYWAQRPIAACRAVLFGQLVDDPSAWPERFPTSEEQSAERDRLHKLIAAMVPWEASNNQDILNRTRWEIARSFAWGRGEEPPPMSDPSAVLEYLQIHAPPVYDPFCGGGSIPLEAQRLGLRAFGSDLNPVAVIISKALVEIPPRFAGYGPVNSDARDERLVGRAWTGARGLAEDVRYYGRWMREEAKRRIGHLYPTATVHDGREVTVIAWLWARTVRSPDPAAKGAMVPLASTFMLSTKPGRSAWVQTEVDRSAATYRLQVVTGALNKENESHFKLGTKAGKGQAFRCVLTGSSITREYIQAEGKAGRLGERLMALVADDGRSRVFLSPTDHHEATAHAVDFSPAVRDARQTFLSGRTPTRAMVTGGVCSAYGLSTWGHLFTPRQLTALVTFSDLVDAARKRVQADATTAGLIHDPRSLHEGGAGAIAYSDAVATYLACIGSRIAEYGSSQTSWLAKDSALRSTFPRQAIPMVWDYAEANPFGKSSGDWDTATRSVTASLEETPATNAASISAIDAPKNAYPIRPAIISTDPPYYDNIGYAELSDFFYSWLRRILGIRSGREPVWPDLFRTLVTPKQNELVAIPYRHGGQQQADAFFMKGMAEALRAIHDVAEPKLPLVIYYAFKQAEEDDDGTSSAGWATFLQAVVDAELMVGGTWPLRTESSARVNTNNANALASSIILSCRIRGGTWQMIEREDFTRALRRELPDALTEIRAAGVGPVDMAQAAIGPGMAVFTRYHAVLEDSGEPMKVRTALALINRIRDEIDQDDDAAYDLETRFALDWFGEAAWEARDSGRAILMANGRDLSLDGLVRASLIVAQGGKTRLRRRDEIAPDMLTGSHRMTVWQGAQCLASALTAEDGGIDKAATVMARLTDRETIRALSYRLYGICSDKSWAQEALVWNRLAEEWRAIEDRVATVPPPTQSAMSFEAMP